jgi:hypothetical protein
VTRRSLVGVYQHFGTLCFLSTFSVEALSAGNLWGIGRLQERTAACITSAFICPTYTLKLEAPCYSETFLYTYKATRCHNLEKCILKTTDVKTWYPVTFLRLCRLVYTFIALVASPLNLLANFYVYTTLESIHLFVALINSILLYNTHVTHTSQRHSLYVH